MSSQSLLTIGLQVGQEALNSLLEMGFPEEEAVNALRKFDNDVERAVEHIFSGQATYDEAPHLVNTNDGAEPMNTDVQNWNNSSTPKSDNVDMAVKASIHEQDEAALRRGVEESLADQSTNDNSMALVPYNSTKGDLETQYDDSWSSLTETDPENPALRTRDILEPTPVGLRPLPRHSFASCIFQALFHIPVFRISMLGFRPTRENWGNVEGYWQGKSPSLSDNQDLISTYNTSPEYRKYSNRYVSLNVVHEMQKLFAFLMQSERSYGDSVYIMKAMEFKGKDNSWPDFFEDLTDFYDCLLTRLCEAARFRDKDALTDEYTKELDEVCDCWGIIEKFEHDIQRIKQEINNITHFEGEYNGLELLQGSINYYERKRDATEPTDTESIERIAGVINFLEKFKARTEEKLNGLYLQLDELQQHLLTIYDRPSLKKIPYRLCAVIVHDESRNVQGQGDWAYILIPKDNDENGDWWKFQNTEVKKVTEEQIFKYDANGIHTLIFVHPDCHYNLPDSFYEALIPTPLKEFVEADNAAFKQEFINYKGRPDPPAYSPTDTGGRIDDSNCWNSDSTINAENTSCDIQRIEMLAKTLRNDDHKIGQRFEIFCARLKQSNLLRILMKEYLENSRKETWDEPLPLDRKYRNDSRFKRLVTAFEGYEEITKGFTEGLECMHYDDYARAFEYFLYTLQREENWINSIQADDDDEGLPLVNNSNIEDIKRSNFIIEHAKICLQTLHQGALEKANKSETMIDGIKNALLLLKRFIRLL
ncbi:8734_t:CDS:10, partial [Ambispora leptoticha]